MGAFLDIPKQNAEKDEENQMKKVEALVKLLETKLEVYENKIQLLRGQSGAKNDSEVAGGRTVQQIKQIRAVSEEGIDKQIVAGINDFFYFGFSSGRQQRSGESSEACSDSRCQELAYRSS